MSITLNNGDCYSIIPSLDNNSVDLVITDPPYSLGNCKGGGLYKPVGSDSPDNPYKRKATNSIRELKDLGCNEFNAKAFLELIRPKMKKFYGFFFCNKPLLPEYLNYANDNKLLFEIFSLIKSNPIPARNNHFLPDTEYCVMLRERGTYFSKNALFDDYKKNYIVSCSGKRLHPAEKPVEFIERFIRVCCPEHGTILDPFMGSGSTGVACKKLGRSFFGIEKNKKYFEIAEERINDKSNEEQLRLSF